MDLKNMGMQHPPLDSKIYIIRLQFQHQLRGGMSTEDASCFSIHVCDANKETALAAAFHKQPACL